MAPKQPYKAEYAKSGRAKCKTCKLPIEHGDLRLAVMTQSKFHDGLQENWHHFTCFFGRARPRSVTDIARYESLRWEDQEKIRERVEGTIGSSTLAAEPKKEKGKKRANAVSNGISDIKDYIIEYAKSSRSKCRLCEQNIPKNDLRISKKDLESEIALQYGPVEKWHHVDCFVKAREEFGFTACGSSLPGFLALSPEEQKMIKSKIPALKKSKQDVVNGAAPSKKAKETKSSSKESVDSSKELLKKQNEQIFFFRDHLQSLRKSELSELLQLNKQWVPQGESDMLDHLSDIMTFGALSECPVCSGQLIFQSGFGYQCTGHISEWSKCEHIVDKPKRVPFKVPKNFKDAYSFMKQVNKETSDRVFTKAPVATAPGTKAPVAAVASSTSTASSSSSSTATQKQRPVLHGLKFFVHKTKDKSTDGVTKIIENLGGKVVKKYDSDIVAVISTEEEINKARVLKAIRSAREDYIHVIAEDFFDNISPTSSREEFARLLDEKKISGWGSKVSSKVPSLDSAAKSVYPEKSGLFKSDKTTAKVTLKGGLAVDPESKLEDIAHVYRKKDDIYSVVLSLADLQSNKNSFYKLQILEGDKKNKYWLFRSWGRIGTKIGGKKVEEYETLQDAIDVFKQLFEEKTENMWELRRDFEKMPGRYMMIDVVYGDDEKAPKNISASDRSGSKLPIPVQDLVTLIFDIEQMKKAMLEFELDLNKMPLGKLSRKQLQKAFGVLSDLQNLISRSADNTLIFDKTNQFYTLVPHNFGIAAPKILNTEQDIKDKITMLNDLMDIEIAYKMLQECDDAGGNPIDNHYEKLNAKISVLQPDSDEFKYIQLYVKNTHAKTHSNYTLDVEYVFKVEREGEDARYEKFKNLDNKKLLWHGSRLTNFAGILSQGLRIAPPEAPVTGYMFGKGIYFADMVSKSANYCATSRTNNTGLMMLCEVALGNMLELTTASYIERLPPGKHSVKGLGSTHPDPTEVVLSPDGVEIPLGKGINAPVKNTSLLYNEYIVYDVAQVKVQYLLKMKFHYK